MLRKHQGIAHNKPYTVSAKVVLLSDLLLLKAVGKYPVLNHCFKELVTVDSGVSIQVLWNTSDTQSPVKPFSSDITDYLESKSYL